MNIHFRGILKDHSILETVDTNGAFPLGDSEKGSFGQLLEGCLLVSPVLIGMIIICYRDNHMRVKISEPLPSAPVLVLFFLSFIALIFAHEYIHALMFPKGSKVDIYIDLKDLTAVTFSSAKVSRKRFFLILIMPSVLLGILPFLLINAVSLLIPVSYTVKVMIEWLAFAGFGAGVYDWQAVRQVKKIPKDTVLFQSEGSIFYELNNKEKD